MAKNEVITLRVEKPLRDAVDRIAEARGIPRGELVRRLIVDEIQRERSRKS